MISLEIINYCPGLYLLALQNNTMQTILVKTFHRLKLSNIISDDYKVCCAVPDGTNCPTKPPWYKSCSNLLPNTILNVFFFVLSVVIIIANILSTILRRVSFVKGFDQSGAFGMAVSFVNVTDILYGIYLLILCIADLIYSGNFVFEEFNWTSSVGCFSTAGIVITFSLLSPCSLFILSFSRLMVVMHPLNTRFKETKFVLKCIFGIFFSVLILSLGVTILLWVIYFHIPLNLCSPFVDPTNQVILIKITTWFTVICQLSAIILILIIYIVLIKELRKSQQRMKKATSRQKSNTTLIVQIIIITGSNILCWIPTGVIYLVSMFMKKYPVIMVIWTTIVVTPINSIINPIVFIFTSIRKITQ